MSDERSSGGRNKRRIGCFVLEGFPKTCLLLPYFLFFYLVVANIQKFASNSRMKKKEEGSQIGNNFCASFVNSKNIENYGFVLCLYYFIIGKCSSSMAQRPF